MGRGDLPQVWTNRCKCWNSGSCYRANRAEPASRLWLSSSVSSNSTDLRRRGDLAVIFAQLSRYTRQGSSCSRVSFNAPTKKDYWDGFLSRGAGRSRRRAKRHSTEGSREIPLRSTSSAQARLTSEIGRDRVDSSWFDRSMPVDAPTCIRARQELHFQYGFGAVLGFGASDSCLNCIWERTGRRSTGTGL